MKRHLSSIHALVFICLACTPSLFAQVVTNKKPIIIKARAAYYTLKNLGFGGYSAKVVPDWETTLDNPEGGVPDIVKTIHFTVTVDPEGKATTEAAFDTPPQTEQLKAAFDQISHGMDQSLALFHQTWAMFMVASPFPDPNDQYQLEEVGHNYRCSFTADQTSIVILMSKDLLIQEMQITAPDYKSSIRPQFSKTTAGLVLTGYNADYVPSSGAGTVYLRADITNQDVDGFKLPQRLNVTSTFNGHPSRMVVSFTDVHATKLRTP